MIMFFFKSDKNQERFTTVSNSLNSHKLFPMDSRVLVNLLGSSVLSVQDLCTLALISFRLKYLPPDPSILMIRSKVYKILKKWNNPLI